MGPRAEVRAVRLVAISPRANETAAVVAILEDDSHNDARSMAAAIVRAVATELSRRELFVVFPPNAPYGVGPYWTETEAGRAWTKEIGAHFTGDGRLLRTFPWEPKPDELASCECGHTAQQHVVPGPKNKPGKPSECGVYRNGRKDSRCPCASYQPRRVA